MPLTGLLVPWGFKIRNLLFFFFFFFFFKYQPWVNKTESNLGKLYVECDYMTKELNKLLKNLPKFF